MAETALTVSQKTDYSDFFEPPPGKIVVLSDKTDESRVGSLYVIRYGKTTAGTVVAIYDSFAAPDGGDVVECFWQVGDRVMYGPNAGMEITLDVVGSRVTFRVLGEKEVLCRVKDPRTTEQLVEIE